MGLWSCKEFCTTNNLLNTEKPDNWREPFASHSRCRKCEIWIRHGVFYKDIDSNFYAKYIYTQFSVIQTLRLNGTPKADIKNIVNTVLRSADKTILIAIYNNQNQIRKIGVKLD